MMNIIIHLYQGKNRRKNKGGKSLRAVIVIYLKKVRKVRERVMKGKLTMGKQECNF
jgi:hypothetical protein